MADLPKITPDDIGMRQIGEIIKELLPTKFGFTLLVYQYGEERLANYLATANREDMILMLRETADRLESKQTFQTPSER